MLTSGLGPTKMRLFKSHECAIYYEAGYGPTFGAGHDLHISGNVIINYDNYTFLDYSYQCRTGQNAKTFLADEKHFTVTDYKVFGLHKNKPSIPSHVRDHKMSKMSSEL